MLFGRELDVYAFVGLIMLIGIVEKNAIMMIDFALTRQREEGVGAEDAIFQACLIRFRPNHDDYYGGANGHFADCPRVGRGR